MIVLLLAAAAAAVALDSSGGGPPPLVFPTATWGVPQEQPDAEVNELRVSPGWLLGEGQPQLNQWAQLAETGLTTVSLALSPVVGPIATAAMNAVAGIIGSIKTKTRWVTPAVPGRWETIALLDGTPPLRIVLRWGRVAWGPSGVRVWDAPTGKKTSGKLPLVQSVSLPNSGDPAWRYVYDGTSKSVANNTRWIQPPGPPMPEIYVAVDGGQTEVALWIPARGGDAKDGDYYYRYEITTG